MPRRTLALLALLATQVAGVQAQATGDSAFVARVARMETQFFQSWRDAWRDSLDHQIPNRVYSIQRNPVEAGYLLDIRCAAESSLSFNMIRSGGRGHAVCPWYADDRTSGRDGDPVKGGPNGQSAASVVRVEAVVKAMLRGTVLAQRHAIVEALDSGTRAWPANAWLIGQRVRFLVEDRDIDGALSVVRTCAVNRWWCSALGGYTLYARGDIAAADSAFQVATAATTGAARCAWTDMRTQLGETRGQYLAGSMTPPDTSQRAIYDQMPCAARDSLNTRLLWLADPFWSDDINEWRGEHFARRMALTLRGGVSIDELYDWSPQFGGDAFAELVMRYGWPSRAEWAGKANDQYVDEYLRSHGQNARPGTPYLTAEYTVTFDTTLRVGVMPRRRLHFVPSWDVLLDPLHAQRSDLRVVTGENYPWSDEHMLMPWPVVQIGAEQTALLRRPEAVLLAYASNLSATRMALHFGDTVTLAVMRSTGPDSTIRLLQRRVDATERFVLRELIPPTPAIIAVELPNMVNPVAARTRFVVTPPPTLNQMHAGDMGISDPVIIQPPVGEAPLPNNPDSALSGMQGTTHMPQGRQSIGVYWETYGFAPGDSVDIVVRVQRHTSQSAVERLGMTFSMLGDRNAPVSITWTEPKPDHASFVTRGTVPIISRSVVLNIASLAKGDYWLDIAVRKKGGEAVVGRRGFVIE